MDSLRARNKQPNIAESLVNGIRTDIRMQIICWKASIKRPRAQHTLNALQSRRQNRVGILSYLVYEYDGRAIDHTNKVDSCVLYWPLYYTAYTNSHRIHSVFLHVYTWNWTFIPSLIKRVSKPHTNHRTRHRILCICKCLALDQTKICNILEYFSHIRKERKIPHTRNHTT